jgi:hypothetical protein
MAMQPDNPLTSHRIRDAKLFDISEQTLDIYANVTALKIEKVNNIVELDVILEFFPKVDSVEIDLLTPNENETAVLDDSFNDTVVNLSSSNNYNKIKSVTLSNFKAARVRDLKFIACKFRKVEYLEIITTETSLFMPHPISTIIKKQFIQYILRLPSYCITIQAKDVDKALYTIDNLTILDPNFQIVFSNFKEDHNSLSFKKNGIEVNICLPNSGDVIVNNLKTAMDNCMISQHDVCLMLKDDDRVLNVIHDVTQKVGLWDNMSETYASKEAW